MHDIFMPLYEKFIMTLAFKDSESLIIKISAILCLKEHFQNFFPFDKWNHFSNECDLRMISGLSS